MFEYKVRTDDREHETVLLKVGCLEARNQTAVERNERSRRFEPCIIALKNCQPLRDSDLPPFEFLSLFQVFLVRHKISNPEFRQVLKFPGRGRPRLK